MSTGQPLLCSPFLLSLTHTLFSLDWAGRPAVGRRSLGQGGPTAGRRCGGGSTGEIEHGGGQRGRAWRQRKAMVTDATCANTLAAAQHGKELPGAARSTMAAAHSDVSVRHGNGKFPVGDYTTRPASADENFPHHHQREMQRGNIFHHHLLRAGKAAFTPFSELPAQERHVARGQPRGRADSRIVSLLVLRLIWLLAK
uniref:Secreted protein n=1 Tax=Oryza barthii TaxID=65489 RepID=A0A0D3H6Z2_9ORYZ